MIITAPEKLRLVFLGDSITVGDGDSKAKGWPARLCAMTSSHPTLTQCYNLGIGGDRIEGLAHRVQSELAVRLAGRTGRGAAIMIGVNDAIRAAATTEQIPLDFDALATNFRHTLREAKNYGPVLIIEPTPVSMTLVRDDGGTVVPMYSNFVDARSSKLAREDAIGGNWELDGFMCVERWWFA